MSAQEAEKVEIHIGGAVKVPEKYAEFISTMGSASPEIWQEVADEWIKVIRVTAAQSGMEVDDLISQTMEEAKAKVAAE